MCNNLLIFIYICDSCLVYINFVSMEEFREDLLS